MTDTAEVRAAIRRDVKSGVLASHAGHEALVAAVDNLCANLDEQRAIILTLLGILDHAGYMAPDHQRAVFEARIAVGQ